MKYLPALLIAFCFSCAPKEKPKPEKVTIKKIVTAKKESMETDYHYKMDWLNGKVRQQPDIHTVYYIVYDDKSYDRVNVDVYALTTVGDTITITK
jgi:hypothetical protein